MSRRRARNLVLALGGVLLLIAIGFVRDAGDSGMTVFESSDEAAEGEAGFTDDFADFSDGSIVIGGGSTGASAGSGASGSRDRAPSALVAEEIAGYAGSGAASGTGGSGGSFASTEADTGSSVGTLPLPPLSAGDRIIKDGRIQVEVLEGQFDRAFDAVLALAAKVGGQVVGSQSSQDGDRASGEVTIRVPAQRFEELLASTSGIGTIQHRQVTSQDVSGEFVDLQARVRHLQAQEQFYLGLLGKARVVGDAIAINQHLSQVQGEIEQAQGRLRLLEERTTYSRLTVSLHEPGVAPLLDERFDASRGVLGRAWDEALLALQQTVAALLVGAFTVAPLAALGLVAWALWRRLRPRRTAAEDPRPAVEDKGPLHVG